jgi:hypothetical protein
MKKTYVCALLLALVPLCCNNSEDRPNLEQALDNLARDYLALTFHLDRHDPGYVDAYFGPVDIKREAERDNLPLDVVIESAAEVIRKLDLLPTEEGTPMRRRSAYLKRMLEALCFRARQVKGENFDFDTQVKNLYGLKIDVRGDEYYDRILSELDILVPGKEPKKNLPGRLQSFQKKFEIPEDKIQAVFQAAVEECRKRTRAHIALPERENFVLEYVEGKSWSAYNWFKGGSVSVIQLNTDLPLCIHQIVDLACHEGYPGHHVYSTLIEQKLVQERGWIEFSVNPLYSPLATVMEGTANYGVELVFPLPERLRFEKQVLLPLAGVKSKDLELLHQILELSTGLTYAKNETARAYLDGVIDREEAIRKMMRYQLFSLKRASKYLDFIKIYGPYLTTYNLGLDLIRAQIEKNTDEDASPEELWKEFERMLSTPIIPEILN